MLIVAGLLIAFVLVVLFANRETRACRWREDRSRLKGGMVLHRCAVCGAERFAPRGKPPKACLRD